MLQRRNKERFETRGEVARACRHPAAEEAQDVSGLKTSHNVVLSSYTFAINPVDIQDVKVGMTIFDGQLIF